MSDKHSHFSSSCDIIKQLLSFTTTKQESVSESVSQLVSQWVSDKHSQWSDTGPIKTQTLNIGFYRTSTRILELLDSFDFKSLKLESRKLWNIMSELVSIPPVIFEGDIARPIIPECPRSTFKNKRGTFSTWKSWTSRLPGKRWGFVNCIHNKKGFQCFKL